MGDLVTTAIEEGKEVVAGNVERQRRILDVYERTRDEIDRTAPTGG